jgi:hypothetical protein
VRCRAGVLSKSTLLAQGVPARRAPVAAVACIEARQISQIYPRSASNSRGGCPVIRLNTREKAAALS